MSSVVSWAAFAVTAAWIAVAITVFYDEGAFVAIAVLFGGMLILRGVFWLILRAFPQLRGNGSDPRSG